MRLKANLALPIAALFFCLAGASSARAQAQSQDAPHPKAEATPSAEVPPRYYRLDYTLTETDAGKKIDLRQYTMTMGGGTNNGRPWQGYVNIGTRVPVGVKSGESDFQYIDVGAKITSSISLRDGAQVLNTHFDFSSVAPDDSKIEGRPLLRTISIGSEAPILMGETTPVGAADDPNSGRKFTLEVTVRQVK